MPGVKPLTRALLVILVGGAVVMAVRAGVDRVTLAHQARAQRLERCARQMAREHTPSVVARYLLPADACLALEEASR